MSNTNNGAITGSTLQPEDTTIIRQITPLSDEMLNSILPGNGKYLLSFLSNDCQVLPHQDFKVYVTKNYSAFSKLAENRDLNEAHVHTLMESFTKDGYLFTIIYVNEKMEKIDGQHRFEAAKRKGAPIFFIIMPGWGIKEVAILNVNSKNWTAEDFMNTHAKGGNQNYIRFKTFYDRFNFDITTAQIILFGRRLNHSHSTTADMFRSGKMELDEGQLSRALKKAVQITKFQDFHPYGYKTRNFVEAMLQLMNVKEYDNGHMIEQLKKYPSPMLLEARMLRTEEYLKLFLDKYNYRKKDKIELA